jgi:signal transduction histidine kinase
MMPAPDVAHPGQILVIDDELPIREVCRRVLEGPGYRVVTAASGEEALENLRQQNFDFVLTDMMMPGQWNGSSLLEMIKQTSPMTDVVIMTGFPSLSTAIPTMKAGAYDYLIKPFDKALLLSVVQRCFEKRRLSDELNREKILHAELQAAYAELQKVEKMKESFLSRLSHELRTPFVSVFFVLDQIESDPAGKTLLPAIKSLRKSVSGLWKVVENMLFFTDLREGDVSSYKVPVEPRLLIKDLIQKFKPEWEKRELTVELSVEGDVESVNGDPQLLSTAFKHLLLNAINFNRKGGAIRIQMKNLGSTLAIAFVDTGIGIPADKLPNVFDNFYQAAEYMTREVGGLGLGLAIVRRIVEAHGGSVTVSSQSGEGSQFTVMLPMSQRSETHA